MAISALVGIGLALSAVGTGIQAVGQQAQTSALKDAEASRHQQLNLDTMRRNRESVRQGIIQRSQALFAASNQGAQGGSGLAGGEAQISGDVGRATTANNQNKQLGDSIFEANQKYYDASGITNFGVGLSSLGGVTMNSAGVINRVGGGFATK